MEASKTTLLSLAHRWKRSQGEVWSAAQKLGVRASRMGAQVTAAEEQRLHEYFFPPRTHSKPKGRRDTSAYLAAGAKKSATAPADGQAEPDLLCSCCEIPLPSDLPANRTMCTVCLQHPDVPGEDRDLVVARRHAERFRAAYLNENKRAEEAERRRRIANRRADRWVDALVRTIVVHDRYPQSGGQCTVCKVASPCPVWRTLERVNPGIAARILNDFYPLPADVLDRTLHRGVGSADDAEPVAEG
jgi:hypothetical protein